MKLHHIVALTVMMLTGCNTTGGGSGLSIPAGWQDAVDYGRGQAVAWYRGKYHAEPKVPSIRVEELPDSRLPGIAAQTVSATRVQVRASSSMSRRRGDMAHEWRHVLNKANNRIDSEETVR